MEAVSLNFIDIAFLSRLSAPNKLDGIYYFFLEKKNDNKTTNIMKNNIQNMHYIDGKNS